MAADDDDEEEDERPRSRTAWEDGAQPGTSGASGAGSGAGGAAGAAGGTGGAVRASAAIASPSSKPGKPGKVYGWYSNRGGPLRSCASGAVGGGARGAGAARNVVAGLVEGACKACKEMVLPEEAGKEGLASARAIATSKCRGQFVSAKGAANAGATGAAGVGSTRGPRRMQNIVQGLELVEVQGLDLLHMLGLLPIDVQWLM